MKLTHSPLGQLYRVDSLPLFEAHHVTAVRVGYGDIPVIEVAITSKTPYNGMVGFARDIAHDYLERIGLWWPDVIEDSVPTVQTHPRRSLFVDQHGKRRYGNRRDFHFAMRERPAGYHFVWRHSQGIAKRDFTPPGFALPATRDDWRIVRDYWIDQGEDATVRAIDSTIPGLLAW